jgi:type VI secretion system protein ImpG
MQDELLTYYDRELQFLRKSAKDFAVKYPKVAGRLRLEEDKCDDPHVERLLQGFAFIAGRIHRKLDDEFSEIAEALLNVLYPHYLAPIPSMAIVQFEPDPDKGQLTGGHTIPRHTALDRKLPDGTRCRFRTCYPVTLWPVDVVTAQFRDANHAKRPQHHSSMSNWRERCAAVLRLKLRCQADIRFADLELDHLRFFLSGDNRLVYPLYELLFNHVLGIAVHSGDPKDQIDPAPLPSDGLRPVGFGKDEGMLPYPSHAFLGYRLLHEYFTFPAKFLFADLHGLKAALPPNCKDELTIDFLLDKSPRQELVITAENFRLGCTPIINLFDKVAEPISLEGLRAEYHLIPDRRQQRAFEVYAIDEVKSISPEREQATRFQPLYSFKHNYEGSRTQAFWHAKRRPSTKKDDDGTEVYLALVDLGLDPAQPAAETLTVQTTCTNRDLPAQLVFGEKSPATGGRQRDFDIEESAAIAHIRCLKKPTPSIRPPLRGQTYWRLISHLSLNYLSLTGGEFGKAALQEILKLYDFTDSAVTQQQIEGIAAVSSRPVIRRISEIHGGAVARGMEVTIAFDEDKYVGSSWFLLAAVLEKFLGLYVSINSFSQLVATTTERERNHKPWIKKWPPRAGEQKLL